MISATRMLCQKYTDLTDAEISYLESYGALLPALANAEQADVFIDCRTVSGRSAIVVCEAKPQTVPSNYRSSILGMLIHWRDEPAVDRSFRLAVATSGVRAVSMPEDRRIVQSVEPLFYEGRLIGVLIYERPALAAEEPPPAGEREAEQASGALDWAAVSPCLDDAVLFLDEEDRVCGFNPAATALYRRMGYIGTLAGMPVNNIQPAALSECDQDRHETGPGQPGAPVPAPPSLLRAGPGGAHHPRPHSPAAARGGAGPAADGTSGVAAPHEKQPSDARQPHPEPGL